MPPKTLDDIPVPDAIAAGHLSEYEIENTEIKTAPGVTLSDAQKLLTGSILDVSLQLRTSSSQGANMGYQLAVRRSSLSEEAIFMDRQRQVRGPYHEC